MCGKIMGLCGALAVVLFIGVSLCLLAMPILGALALTWILGKLFGELPWFVKWAVYLGAGLMFLSILFSIIKVVIE